MPSLAVLRPRGEVAPAPRQRIDMGPDKPRKRLPSWDDVLFGSAPAPARLLEASSTAVAGRLRSV